MRIVLQRVSVASVRVFGDIVGCVNKGYVLFAGFTHADTQKTAEDMARKIISLRIWEDETGKLNKSIQDVGGSLLVVSQFTLYADCTKGNRPSFTDAARVEVAEPLYLYFVEKLRAFGVKVETGTFGAHMMVELVNDGPITICLDMQAE